jgi:23S rRNA (pseudouridine1915-N3)-methyltransferase
LILRLVHPGAKPRGPLDDAAADYQTRLGRHFRVEEIWVKPSKRPEVGPALAEEADRIVGSLRDRDHLVLLDRVGPALSSEQLAARLDSWMQAGHGAVVFALGSASGLGASLRTRPRVDAISFGPLTLPHDLARLVLWEQLYRASTILRGEPYHK